MDLLLTGASGFIGRNFLLKAPDDWRIVALYRQDPAFAEFLAGLNRPNLTAVQCDLADPAQIGAVFEAHGREWECCLYLAGKVDIPWSVEAPKEDLLWNTGSLLNLLQGLNCNRFVYFSSGAVYDGLKGEVHPDARFTPTLPYAISKQASERYVEAFHRRKRTVDCFLIVRFFGAYGPYEASHKIYTRLIRAFAIEGQDAYTIYGSGKNLIDAMYIDDAIEAVRRILAGSHWNDTVNLAGGNPLTIETLVRDVAASLGCPFARVEKEGVAHEDNLFWGSTREMREYWNFEPRVTLADGVHRFKEFLIASTVHG